VRTLVVDGAVAAANPRYHDRGVAGLERAQAVLRDVGSVAQAVRARPSKEAFFATVECEPIDRHVWVNREEPRLAVFDYVGDLRSPALRHITPDHAGDLRRRAARSGRGYGRTPAYQNNPST
jgi:hypothetical protein